MTYDAIKQISPFASYATSYVASTLERKVPGGVAMSATGPAQENARTAMVSVRLSPEEQDALRAEAAEHGETLSQFIRSLLLRRASSALGAADVSLYPASSTAVVGGLAVEAQDGQLVPRTTHPYVSPIVPG